jgi:hypothetical protein
MISARFRLAAPAETQITLTLTAAVKEFAQVADALDGVDGPAAQFAKQLRDLVYKAQADIATERWTTGYATGPVEAAQ